MNPISRWRRRRAIRQAAALRPRLVHRYGGSRHYTAGQVETSARIAGLSSTALLFGFALYLDRDDFLHRVGAGALDPALGAGSGSLVHDYDALRLEAGDALTSGGGLDTWLATAGTDAGFGSDGGGIDAGASGGMGGGTDGSL